MFLNSVLVSYRDCPFNSAYNKAKDYNKSDFTFAKPIYTYNCKTFELNVCVRTLSFSKEQQNGNPPKDIFRLIHIINDLRANIPYAVLQLKLTKLMINLAGCPKWPLTQQSVDHVANVFLSYQSLIESNDLEPKHQKDFTAISARFK